MLSEYRFAHEYGGPRHLRFIGAILLGVAAIIALTLWGAPGVAPATYPILGIAGAAGLGLIVVGRFFPRREFTLTRDGLRAGRSGAVVPWGEMTSARLDDRNDSFDLFAADGRQVASIPTHLPGIDHLVLLLVDALPVKGAASAAFVTGTQSNWRKFLTYGGALALGLQMLLNGPGSSSTRGWIGFVMLVALLMSQVYSAWRRSGRMELVIDAEGMRGRDRFGPFAARWGEIEDLSATFAGFHHEESPSLLVRTIGQRPRRISLAGMELVEVLSALRTHAPIYWARLVTTARQGALPPADAQPLRFDRTPS